MRHDLRRLTNRAWLFRLLAAVVAFTAMVCTASACTVGVTGHRPSPPPGGPPRPPELDAASEVWPEATFTVPSSLGGEPTVQPVAILGANQVLMVAPLSTRPRFVTYDLRTGRHRVLATAPEWSDCDLCFEIRSVAVSETRITWTAGIYRSEPWNAGKRHVELWTMPRSGGRMRLVTWLTGHGDLPFHDELTVDEDQALWRDEARAYRIPLSGGKAMEVPFTTGMPPAPQPDPDLDDQVCGVEWCVGRVPPRAYELTTMVVRRRDGSGRVTVPASSGGPLIGDRFGLFGLPYVYGPGPVEIFSDGPESAAVLYDRCAGTSALVGAQGKKDRSHEITQGASVPGEPILFWMQQDEKRYTVLDLARVPDQPCGR
ncbi:hypothetical protein [Streptosporangium carneum]|nr:hypothetical protein [Streptosporangium carneum]